MYLLYPDEPHNDLRDSSLEVRAGVNFERFFHDHLGGRYEPIGTLLKYTFGAVHNGKAMQGYLQPSDSLPAPGLGGRFSPA